MVETPDENGFKESATKLRRRDTPHHLKNKRINLSSTTEDAEAKVKAILAQAGKPRESGTGSGHEVCHVTIMNEKLIRFRNRFSSMTQVSS